MSRHPTLHRPLAAAVAATAVWLVGRVARQLARERHAHRAAAARLHPSWVTLPAGPAGEAVPVHARVATDPAPSSLPPVVLVHGYGVSSAYFVGLAERLAGRARVYAPDLPGHGLSGHLPRPLTIPELATVLGRWMDAHAIRRALLVGQSMGCQIVAECVVGRPDLAAGVALIGPTVDPVARSALELVARGALSAPFERMALDALVLRDYARAGPRLVLDEMRHMLAHRVEERLVELARLAVPVRVVRGAHDYIAPQRWVEQVARLAGAPAPVVVPRWGHAVQYGAPDTVADHVLAFARQLALGDDSPACCRAGASHAIPAPSGR